MDPREVLIPAVREALAGLPLTEPERAERLLLRTAERTGSPREAALFLTCLGAAVAEAADPESALLHLERWSALLPTPSSTLRLLREDPRLLADLLSLFGASRYLSDILVRDPSLYGMFAEGDSPRTRAQYDSAVRSAVRALGRPESRRDALRRVKRREFLRIGWRDLARRAPLTEITGEISDLADSLVEAALELAREEVDPRFPEARQAVRLAVIAMGKLGARELNYSSDIDLMFVMDTDVPQSEAHRRYGSRLAETLIAVLAEESSEGRCFRVDMRLRPEGRMGALARSYGAFREYYDRWVETWERQALIKARPVAGDRDLGERFMALIEPVVYRRLQAASLIEDVREMRAAVEQKLDGSGVLERDLLERNVKEGRGTIREVEFTVQLLQLLFGADHPHLRARDTWRALERLEAAGLLTPEERRTFGEGYRFFREVEHRLQLMNDLPVRLVPVDPAELRRLGRSMGLPDGDTFLECYRKHSMAVRELADAIHARLGAEGGAADGGRTAVLRADQPEGAGAVRAELERRGFPEPERALEALVRLAAGAPQYRHPSATRRLFADLYPHVMDACSAAADPTWALQGLADFTDRKVLHRALYQTWLEHPEALRSLCAFAGGAPVALRTVVRYPELSDQVTDEELLARRRTREELEADLGERMAAAQVWERKLSVLRRFKLREYVRLAARRVLRPVPAAEETAEWSGVADTLLRAALSAAVERAGAPPGGFAVLGLGRLGGRDLHFASDLDLMYVFRAGEGRTQQEFELIAQSLGQALQAITDEGKLFDLDLRLRPEGKQGFSVASLEAVRRYYGEGGRAETWEFQMLTRARPVAGDESVSREFLEIVRPRVYRTPMPELWPEEIRAMKRRIETERVRPAERERHVKLGPGGLSDIEFLVQYLQLAHGGETPEVRDPTTVGAIRALALAGRLAPEEARTLLAGHDLLTRIRQTLALLPDARSDLLPLAAGEERLGAALARALRFDAMESLHEEYRRATARVRDVFTSGIDPQVPPP
jgi:glutamate-ammonia-ligase adenylyltransferase